MGLKSGYDENFLLVRRSVTESGGLTRRMVSRAAKLCGDGSIQTTEKGFLKRPSTHCARRDYSSEFRIVLPDGTVKHLEAINHHLFSADGELVQVVGTNVDVTERKRAEQALREREAKFGAWSTPTSSASSSGISKAGFWRPTKPFSASWGTIMRISSRAVYDGRTSLHRSGAIAIRD